MGGEDCPAPGQSIGSSCIDPDIMAALNVLRCFALKAGQISGFHLLPGCSRIEVPYGPIVRGERRVVDHRSIRPSPLHVERKTQGLISLYMRIRKNREREVRKCHSRREEGESVPSGAAVFSQHLCQDQNYSGEKE